MIYVSRLILTLSLAVFSGFAQASDSRDVTWDMLAPEVPAIANPFESLTEDQLDALRKILRYEMRAEQGGDDEKAAEIEVLRARLVSEGLDVEGLFAARKSVIEKREAAASAINEDLVGARIRMPGYILPLEFNGLKTIEFLLVPTVGACIHTPPPPANQIVHVEYPDGIEVNGLFTPVWITGTMMAESSVQDVGFVDGQAPVAISYKMQPDLVEEYGE